MSTTALAPALDLDGPLPVARPHSLLTVPGVLSPPGDERWLSGVNLYGYPAGTPLAWEPCSTGTSRVKSESAVTGEEDPQPSPRFDSIALYFPLTCSASSLRNQMELSDRVELALAATQSEGVESVLSKGVALSTNPFFADTNMTALAGGAAVAPQVGLGYLENAIAATGRGGMIHATPAVVATLGFNYLRCVDPDGIEDNGDEYLVTSVGTPVVSGAGYVGAHPIGQPGPSTTKDWVFATGPVEVYLTDGVRTDISESLDRSDDTVIFRAERYMLGVWDGALQAGVLIDWSLA